MKDIHLYYRSAYSDYLEKICGCVYNTKSSFCNLNFFKKKVRETTSSRPRVFAPTVSGWKALLRKFRRHLKYLCSHRAALYTVAEFQTSTI